MTARLASLVVFFASVAAPVFPQAGTGSWSQTYDWTNQVVVKVGGQPACLANESEFSSAALIPTGFFAGSVIMWRKERAWDGGQGQCVAVNTNVTWVFDPSIPSTLIKFRQDEEIESDIFCAGQSWDPHGQLVVAGGVPTGGEIGQCEFPVETYRLRPENMSGIIWDINTSLPSVYYDSRLPWKKMGDMAIKRYYPTVMPLGANDTYTSQAHGSIVMKGGSSFCAGGPWCAGNDGNEFWELLEGKKTNLTNWYPPLIPVSPTATDPIYGGPNAPHFGTGPGQVEPSDFDVYTRPEPVANRLLDSYPRMFQLNDQNRSILICGDVDTGEQPANAPGSTWVIEPRINSTGAPQNWELHKAQPGLDPDGSGPDIWHDNFYDTSACMSQVSIVGLRLPDRVLMFGGSRNTAGPSTNDWVANSKVWEFAYSGTVLTGSWEEKPAPSGANLVGDEFHRLYGNAVWLPTGEVFFEGGSKLDDWVAHNGYTGGTCSQANPKQHPSTPNDVPIIFDPGSGPSVARPGDHRGKASSQPGL